MALVLRMELVVYLHLQLENLQLQDSVIKAPPLINCQSVDNLPDHNRIRKKHLPIN